MWLYKLMILVKMLSFFVMSIVYLLQKKNKQTNFAYLWQWHGETTPNKLDKNLYFLHFIDVHSFDWQTLVSSTSIILSWVAVIRLFFVILNVSF